MDKRPYLKIRVKKKKKNIKILFFFTTGFDFHRPDHFAPIRQHVLDGQELAKTKATFGATSIIIAWILTPYYGVKCSFSFSNSKNVLTEKKCTNRISFFACKEIELNSRNTKLNNGGTHNHHYNHTIHICSSHS
ncbi:hypothetical protein G4B88_031089 [Cannabis sativa]|uniref:Uncharacterized protein n=1 Tax=Cannabis sativa TaxID=3483 RepID=A0A7J6GSP0_CANSA|nr:hypothetical protein G4B88_031089 [Cannabis sativa]